MSLLPQRKKTAEEIAQLRETLGVPALHEVTDGAPAAEFETLVSTHHEAIVEHHAETPEPAPAPANHGPKPVHSLKRSERVASLPDEESELDKEVTEVPQLVPHLPKPVRSLRKSEQVPVLVPTPARASDDSKLPFHRHSDEEIEEIRRREALARMTPPPPNPKLAAAHVAILIPGYLFAIAGASCFFFYEFPMAATAGCAAAALLISAFVFVRRPLSRHHAAFISVISLFVLVFGTLHYFPQLQHAT